MEWNEVGLVLQINVISLYRYITTEETWGIKIRPPSLLLGEIPPKGTIVQAIIVRLGWTLTDRLFQLFFRGRHGHDRMVCGFITTYTVTVSITTNVSLSGMSSLWHPHPKINGICIFNNLSI